MDDFELKTILKIISLLSSLVGRRHAIQTLTDITLPKITVLLDDLIIPKDEH
jgi:hypothetical protein